MKKTLLSFLLLFIILFVASCVDPRDRVEGQLNDEKQVQYINLATGQPDSTHHLWGLELGNILNSNNSSIRITAVETGGALDNIRQLRDGKTELAVTRNDLAYHAYNGASMFKNDEVDEITGIAALYPEAIICIVNNNVGINSIADLEGKIVAVGTPGSETETFAQIILAAHGLTYENMEVEFLSHHESIARLENRYIDAVFLIEETPSPSVAEIIEEQALKIISLEDNVIEFLLNEYPYFIPHTIKTGTHTSQYGNIKTLAVKSILAVRADMDSQVVYQLTRVLFQETDKLENDRLLNSLTLESAKEGMSIPLHPGAKKYYKNRKITP